MTLVPGIDDLGRPSRDEVAKGPAGALGILSMNAPQPLFLNLAHDADDVGIILPGPCLVIQAFCFVDEAFDAGTSNTIHLGTRDQFAVPHTAMVEFASLADASALAVIGADNGVDCSTLTFTARYIHSSTRQFVARYVQTGTPATLGIARVGILYVPLEI